MSQHVGTNPLLGTLAAAAGVELSPQQHRLWLQQRGGNPFCVQLAVEIEGELDAAALRTALATLIARVEILRTVFPGNFPGASGDEPPRQVVLDDLPPQVREADLSVLPAAEREAQAAALLARDREEPFNLEAGPVLRIRRVVLGPGRTLLAVCLPALCADAPGLEEVLRGWGAAYGAVTLGEDAAPEILQYADYSAWQHQLLREEEAAVGKGYWRDQMASANLGLDLAWERRVANGAGFAPAGRSWRVEPRLAAEIAGAAGRCEISPGSFLLACWGLLLARLSGRDDLVVGVVSDGRSYEELAGAPGLFSRWLPVRAQVDGTMPFARLARLLHTAWQEGDAWQEYFTWSLAGGEEATFSAGFELAREGEAPRFGDLPAAWRGRWGHVERFKLHLLCREDREGLRVELCSDPRSWDGAAVEVLGRQLLALAAAAARRPETAAGDLEILDESERRRLIDDVNAMAVDFPSPLRVHELFAARAALHPERPAVVCEDETISYGRLDAEADRLARHLRRRGVGPDVPVGVSFERSTAWLVALLGVLKAGGAYVPLDPDNPAERLRTQLREGRIPVLITTEELLARWPELPAEAVCLDRDRAALAAEEAGAPEVAVDRDNLAYVIFTSGSTGVPKGVAVTHGNLGNYLEHMLRKLGLRPEAGEPDALSFVMVSTFAADLGNTAIYPALLTGGTLHVVRYERATDAGRFLEYARRHPIDLLKIVPSHLRALLAEAGPGVLPRRLLVLGGEELGSDLGAALLDAAPGCLTINHYGPTETTIGCITCDVTRETVAGTAVPLGRPISNMRAYVVDGDLRPVPAGAVGEIVMGGAGISRGYLHRPDLTAARYVPDPVSGVPGGRLYRSGDRGCQLPDGSLRFLGRDDDQLKIRGHRVEPGEVQAALRACPGVREAAVLPVEEAPGRKRLAAWVVAAEGAALTAGELQRFLAERVPEPMIPSSFTFLDALPLNRNGKVDRKALPAAAAPARAERVLPRTPVEELLVRVWSQALGNPEVGIRDNFFELGGDSILSIQIVARARREGCLITVKQVYDCQTVEELARVAGTAEAVQAEQGSVVGDVPLTPVQRRFFEQEPAAPQHFNMSLLLKLKRPVEPRLLEAAVEHLLAHHDALRFRFHRAEGAWTQTAAAPGGAVPFQTIDLSALPLPSQRGAMETAGELLQRSLDPGQGPVLRAALFDRGLELQGRLLFVVHHLVMDAVSWRLLLEDFQAAVRGLERGEAVALPPKTTSFQQWAGRLADHAAAPETLAETDVWAAMARREVRPLPVDAPAAPDPEGLARTLTTALEEGETKALQEMAATGDAHVHETLLAALALAVSRWTGGRAVLVDLEGHGREDLFADVDLSRTIGWFTTHYPVLLDLGRAVAPAETLRAVRDQVRRIPRRGIGFGLLRETLGDLPVPEIGFNYLGVLDQILPESDLLAPAPEFPGAERDPAAPRALRLGVHGEIAGGRLRLHWTYGERAYRRETIQSLADSFLDALRSLLAGSRESEPRYAPTDFPDVDLGQEELDSILQQIGSQR
jgi:amino acid adenylation domain-containing protein/non-ribosomal peptide synthase protein (TIGR01720 family)